MIGLRSMLNVADNSGATKLQVIHIFGGSWHRFGKTGNILRCVVIEASPESQIKKGDKVLAVLVRSRKEVGRPDGSYIRFSDNAGVLIDTARDKNPRGTRILGPVAREIKEKGFIKIASMAKEVL